MAAKTDRATFLTEHDDVPGMRRRAAGAGRSRSSPLLIVVVAALAGLALARFLVFDADSAALRAARDTTGVEDRISQLERAVETDPQNLESWQSLGVAYVRRAMRTGDPAPYTLAERAFDRADELAPAQPETLLGRGLLALSLHDFEHAGELALQAHRKRPFDVDILGVLVDAEVELGHYNAAAERLQEMLGLRPDLRALSRASYLRQLHGDLDGAVEAMQQAVTAGAGSPVDVATVTTLLGDLHFARGNLAAAADRYEDALRTEADHIPARTGRARVLAAGGDRKQAVHILTEVTQRYPRPDALVLLADLQRLVGDAHAAQATDEVVRATAALQREGGQAVDLEMALFEADRGQQPQLAVEMAQAAYDARPQNVYAADALAWATAAAGDPHSAVPLIENALRLGTADALVRYHAATIFAAAGQPDRARAELEAAFALNPWFSFAHRDEAAQLARRLGVTLPDAWEAA